MPRPVARPLPPRPTAELPRWFLKLVPLGLLVAGAIVLLWKVNQANQRLQAEQRLAADPVLGAWLTDTRNAIEARDGSGAGPATGDRRQAEAVWLGRVRSLEFITRQGEGPRLSDVTLDPAYLVAGRRSPRDPRGDSGVRISVLGHQWPRGEPREGEPWVFSVYRINEGNNVAHTAFPAP